MDTLPCPPPLGRTSAISPGVLWVWSQCFQEKSSSLSALPRRRYWWLQIPELTPVSPGGSGLTRPPLLCVAQTLLQAVPAIPRSFASGSDAVDAHSLGPCTCAAPSPWVPRRLCRSSASAGSERVWKRRTSRFWKDECSVMDAPHPGFTATQPRSQIGLKIYTDALMCLPSGSSLELRCSNHWMGSGLKLFFTILKRKGKKLMKLNEKNKDSLARWGTLTVREGRSMWQFKRGLLGHMILIVTTFVFQTLWTSLL